MILGPLCAFLKGNVHVNRVVYVGFRFCSVVSCVRSSFVIILLRRRETSKLVLVFVFCKPLNIRGINMAILIENMAVSQFNALY